MYKRELIKYKKTCTVNACYSLSVCTNRHIINTAMIKIKDNKAVYICICNTYCDPFFSVSHMFK